MNGSISNSMKIMSSQEKKPTELTCPKLTLVTGQSRPPISTVVSPLTKPLPPMMSSAPPLTLLAEGEETDATFSPATVKVVPALPLFSTYTLTELSPTGSLPTEQVISVLVAVATAQSSPPITTRVSAVEAENDVPVMVMVVEALEVIRKEEFHWKHNTLYWSESGAKSLCCVVLCCVVLYYVL